MYEHDRVTCLCINVVDCTHKIIADGVDVLCGSCDNNM